ncbi:MAG TPA: cyclophilin-like fold protein [Mucilaginibacter sp.]|jgi:hypothetical protein
MKRPDQKISVLLLICSLFLTSFSNAKKEDKSNATAGESLTNQKMTIKINSQTFTATMLDNNTAKAFRQMLPITIHMTELNGNEKYFDLHASLPAQAVKPGNIRNGDIMLYGSNTIVLFYKNFETSYDYTKIGTIDNIENYAAALGTGNATVAFEAR